MGVHVNLSGGAGRQLDLSRLPVEHADRGQRAAGVFLVLFSLVWGGIPTLVVLASALRGRFEPAMLAVLIFTVIGTILFLVGLRLLTTRRRTRFEADRVSFEERSIFGHRAWMEPLDRFPGVRRRSEYHSGGKNRSSYTLYLVELHHPDKKKRIRLYESRAEAGHRKIHEQYCRWLNLPAIEGDEANPSVRAVEDLDKTVRDLAREGKVEIAFDPSKPPPAGLRLRAEGRELRIELPKPRVPAAGCIIALIVVGAVTAVGFGVPGAPRMLGVIGLLFLLLMIAGAVWSAVAHPVVVVGTAAIRSFYRTPWGETAGRSVAAERIESVRIGRRIENQGAPAVLLVTDEGTTAIGDGLPPDALEWLKNCILTVITR